MKKFAYCTSKITEHNDHVYPALCNILGFDNLYEGEELDILGICHNIKPRIIKYELLSKPTIETFKTRKEEQIETYIIKELKKIEEEGNSEKLKYLYLEWTYALVAKLTLFLR